MSRDDLFDSDTPPRQDPQQMKAFTLLDREHASNYDGTHRNGFCKTCGDAGMLLQNFIHMPEPKLVEQDAFSTSRECTIEDPDHPVHEWYYERPNDMFGEGGTIRGNYLCRPSNRRGR